MKSITLQTPAKINLSLDVLRDRDDGYHDVKMIMQTIDLHDEVLIEEAEKGIDVECSNEYIPSGRDNIAYKAAKLLMECCGLEKGVKIKIRKRIPASSGLGGGSSDAAAVLKGMNEIFALGLGRQELSVLGKKIGADVPYFLWGGTALAEGIGEIITELKRLSGVDIVLVMPNFSVSTAWVYGNLDFSEIGERPDTDLLVKAVLENRVDIIAKNMRNVLETVTIKRHGIIAEIKSCLVELGALGSMMSGSGPSVFGIYADKQSARYACERMKDRGWDCILTRTL